MRFVLKQSILEPNTNQNMIRFKGRLDHSIILGSTIRCYYQVGPHQLTVDLLNCDINKRELEKETDLYIHQDHIVAIDG